MVIYLVMLLTLSSRSENTATISQNFLTKHCTECHDEDVQKGDLRLDNLQWNFNNQQNFDVWKKVYKAIEQDDMPPKKKLSEEVSSSFLSNLRKELIIEESKRRKYAGRSIVRRLTKKEYENTIKDIFDVPYIDIARFLPEDGRYHGFNKSNVSLDFSAVHLKNYMDAADALLRSCITPGSKPKVKTVKGKIQRGTYKERYYAGDFKKGGEFWIFTRGNNCGHCITASLEDGVEHAGYYEVEFKAKAVQTNKPFLLKFFSKPDRKGTLQSEWAHFNFYEVEPNKWQTYKERVWMEKDSKVSFTTPDTKHDKTGGRIVNQPSVAVKDIIVKGPFYDEWPLKRHSILWGDLKFRKEGSRKKSEYNAISPANPSNEARSLINNFMNKVFLRSVSSSEIGVYYGIFNEMFRLSNDFQLSLLTAYKAILCSPIFLYKQESSGYLTQEELAYRLSYFLWNSRPDEQLMDLARQNRLKGEELRNQVNRLLDDKKSMRFVNDFNEQWLHLSDLFVTDPDPVLYPEATPALFNMMKQETNLFVKELIDFDLSAFNVIDSNFAILNGPLARHYGIPGVKGGEMRRIQLPKDHERGGIITHGSILKVTANGTVTSPITRGVWFLENIIGTPPPAPPNAVPAFEPKATGEESLRDGLAKHRSNAACNSCHRKIDPPGFAFESFDPIGGFRTHYRIYGGKRSYQKGGSVENKDSISGKGSFSNIQQFKRLILSSKGDLVKNILNKLTLYSTGQELGLSDNEELKIIFANAAESNYGLRSLIHELVQSKIFRGK